MAAGLPELQAAIGAEELDVAPREERTELRGRGEKALIARVSARTAGGVAVPEVDRERAVWTVDENVSAAARDAQQLARECSAFCVACWFWTNGVMRHAEFLDADVLDHAGGDHDIEEAVGKRQRGTVR